MALTNQLAALAEHSVRRYFIWIISCSYLAAGLWPQFGLWMRSFDLGTNDALHLSASLPLPSVLLAFLLFNGGLGVNPAELKSLLGRPLVLLGGLVGNVLTPLAFIIAVAVSMRLWHNPDEAQQILVGLALVAAMPIAGASTAWAQNANGNLALSLGLVALTTALSPFLTPAVLHAAGFLTSGDYSEDLHELASGGAISFLGTWVVLPCLLGILGRSLLADGVTPRVVPYLKLGNYCVLVLLNYSNASLALPNVMSHPDKDFLAITLGIVIALCIAGFSAGYLVSQIFQADRRETASLMFGLGMNNNGAGLVLASLELGDHPEVMLPVIFYNLTQHFVASLVDFSVFRRLPHDPGG